MSLDKLGWKSSNVGGEAATTTYDLQANMLLCEIYKELKHIRTILSEMAGLNLNIEDIEWQF